MYLSEKNVTAAILGTKLWPTTVGHKDFFICESINVTCTSAAKLMSSKPYNYREETLIVPTSSIAQNLSPKSIHSKC